MLLGGVLAEYPNFYWAQDSRNKRSLSIDFTTPAGREAIDRLLRRSDMVITNYRPELLARLKLTYKAVRALTDGVSTPVCCPLGKSNLRRVTAPLPGWNIRIDFHVASIALAHVYQGFR